MSEPNRDADFNNGPLSSGGRQLNTERLYFSGAMRSVDYWPLAKISIRRLGVSCNQ